jgi:hypothetical protein
MPPRTKQPTRFLSPSLGATAGMVGPAMFLAILAVLDLIDRQVEVSGHELGRAGLLMHLNFLAFGVLTLAFATALRSGIRSGMLAWVGTGLLWLFGLGPVLATFTLDPGSGAPTTWHGTLHDIGFLLLALSLIPACLVFAWLFRKDRRWRGFQWYSLATGIALAAVVFAPPTSGSDAYPIWTGPASMLELVLECAWLQLIAVRLWQLTRQTEWRGLGNRMGTTSKTAMIEER